ncbi:hypothetical protein ACS0TY_005092 [Phlomoides rotata]
MEVRDIIKKQKIDMCCIQETKWEEVTKNRCMGLWGNPNLDWASRESEGRSGGILTIWNNEVFHKSSSWSTRGVLVINGFFTGDGSRGVLMNVYAPCSSPEKTEVWDIIKLTVNQNMDARVCVVGDFNSIRRPEERVGRQEQTDNRDIQRFEEFIQQSNLQELPMVGRSYTCYRPDGSCKSKIDRMFVNTEWLRHWPNQILKGLRRSFSDHIPLVLLSGTKDWGPRPFRFMNCWLEHPQFKAFFQEKWKSYNIEGWAAYRLKEKLKLLKKDLRDWNKYTFGDIDHNIESKMKEIEVLDRIDDVMGLEEAEVIQRNKSTAELIRFGQWKERLLAQKAKARWLKDGDVNSSYFHGWINKNRKTNSIDGLIINDRWSESVEEVKKGTHEHFEKQFLKTESCSQTLKRNRGRGSYNGNMSGWWRELCNLYVGDDGRGVRQDLLRIVGEGKSTKFWRDIWVGTEPLSRTYTRLFRISTQQEEHIDRLGKWSETGWEWDLKWRRGLRISDQILLDELMSYISRFTLRRNEEDVWQWRHTSDGLFSTASAYQKLGKTEDSETAEQEQEQKKAYIRLWNNFAPRRYQAIVWKMLHNRLPTKERLQRMGIIPGSDDIKCAMCGEEDETAMHLAINCRIVHNIRSKVHEWMGMAIIPHSDPRINLLQHSELLGHGKKKRIASTIWTCTTWAIWNCRNKATFSEEIPNVNKVIGDIKARSWNWVIAKSKEMRGSSFTDWSNDIRRCCGDH